MEQKPMTEHYILLEAVNFHSSVYDTNQLSVIRGASISIHIALDDIEAKFVNKSAGNIKISRGGSYLLFVTQVEDIASFKIKLSSCLNDHPLVSMLISATQKQAQDTLMEIRVRLSNDIRAQQGRLVSLYTRDLSNKATRACALDNARPQSDKTINGKQTSEYAWLRYEIGKDNKHNFIGQLLGAQLSEDICFTNDLIQLSTLPAHEINEPTKNNDQYHQDSKIAVLYFDGNKMQQHQQMFTDNHRLHEFDQALLRARKSFLSNLIDYLSETPSCYEHVNEGGKTKKQLKLELLLFGGDELLLVVPSWAGLMALSLFYQAFSEDNFQSKDQSDRPTHAGGLLIAPSNTPIKQLTNTVQQLAEHAKEITREHDSYYYLVLESIDYPNESIQQFFAQRYPKDLLKQSSGGRDTGLGDVLMPMLPPSPENIQTLIELKEQVNIHNLNTGLRSRLQTDLSNFPQVPPAQLASIAYLSDDIAAHQLDKLVDCFAIPDKRELEGQVNSDNQNDNSDQINKIISYYSATQVLQPLIAFYEMKRYITAQDNTKKEGVQ